MYKTKVDFIDRHNERVKIRIYYSFLVRLKCSLTLMLFQIYWLIMFLAVLSSVCSVSYFVCFLPSFVTLSVKYLSITQEHIQTPVYLGITVVNCAHGGTFDDLSSPVDLSIH